MFSILVNLLASIVFASFAGERGYLTCVVDGFPGIVLIDSQEASIKVIDPINMVVLSDVSEVNFVKKENKLLGYNTNDPTLPSLIFEATFKTHDKITAVSYDDLGTGKTEYRCISH